MGHEKERNAVTGDVNGSVPITTRRKKADDVAALFSDLGLESYLLDGYVEFLDTLGKAVPERLLALCGLRVAAIHGEPVTGNNGTDILSGKEVDAINRGDLDAFTGTERAALQLTERIPLQWHELTDPEVQSVVSHIGEAGCVALMTAIAFFDTNCRLQATLASLSRHQ